MDVKELSLLIKDYFPNESVDYVAKQIISLDFRLEISKKRNTRLGVFKPTRCNGRHCISINGDLEKNLFFLVYLHEVAHLIVWNNFKRRVAPHGKEWISQYRNMLVNSLNNNHFPEEFKEYVSSALKKDGFQSSITRKLFRNENKTNKKSNQLIVSDLPENSLFTLSNGRTFSIVNKVRTRYKCRDLNNGKLYLVSSHAEVANYVPVNQN